MTYAEIAKERDDLKTENGTLRSIMDKMLEKGKSLEDENKRLKIQLEQANAGIVNCSGCALIEKQAVEEFAEKLKEKMGSIKVAMFTVEEIDELLEEYEK